MGFLFNLKGLVSKKEYIKYFVWSILTLIIVSIFFSVYFTLIVAATLIYGESQMLSYGLIGLLVALAIFILCFVIQTYIVMAKRLRSAKKPAGLVFLGFIGLMIIPWLMAMICNDYQVAN